MEIIGFVVLAAKIRICSHNSNSSFSNNTVGGSRFVYCSVERYFVCSGMTAVQAQHHDKKCKS